LVRFDRDREQFTTYDQRNGLPEGVAGMPRKQIEGCAAAWIVTHAAPPADSKVPTRGACHRVNGEAVPCSYGVRSCAQSNRMKRILREQRQFLPSSPKLGR
jgi:hypothetical protein